METKRTIIAVALSLLVLFGWQILAEHMGWVPQRAAPAPITAEDTVTITPPAAQTADGAPAQTTASTSQLPVFIPTEGREVTVDTPLYKAVFHSGGGFLKSFVLKHYTQSSDAGSPLQNLANESSFPMAPMGLLVNGLPSWSTGQWSFEGSNLNLTNGQTGTLTFTGMVDGLRLRREFTFDAATFLISETVRMDGAEQARSVRLGFKVGSNSFAAASEYDKTQVAWVNNGSLDTMTDDKKLTNEGFQEQGALQWGGVMNNYFMAVVAPESATNITLKARIQDGFWGVLLEQGDITVQPGSETSVNTLWWYGAKDRDLLANAPANLEDSVYLGWFSLIAKPLLYLLVFFHGFVGNWGVAIILLTFCIRVLFFPLSQKSYKSMEKMKQLQPQMQKLKEKHGNDREAMNREVMQLYKTYGANPASGCLPILVQLPVFVGLYNALMNSVELRHAVFIPTLPFTDLVWLADLSARDPLYISPILMGATMFLQQKLSPPMGEPIQQKIMMALPIVFTVMFLNFPSGLVIYWFFNNLLSIAQQWLIMGRKRPA